MGEGRARRAEPLFVPTIGAAIRARKPVLMFYCPGCQVVGELNLQNVDRHPGASIESLIPFVSCTRCSPNPPFAKLIGLRRLARDLRPPAGIANRR